MDRPLKFAAVLPLADYGRAREVALAAERSGFYAVAAEDHFFMGEMGRDPHEPRLECFTLLAALAPVTRSLVLSQIVTANSFRHPAVLAKIVSSLHCITAGRVELGIGAGWYRAEYEAFGFPYPRPSERIAQLAEALQVIKRLWADGDATFDGKFYRLRQAPHEPKPRPRPRIMIGGGGPKLLRVAAAEADVVNIIPPSGGARGRVVMEETLAFDLDAFRRRVDLLAEYCKEIGRPFEELEISAMVYVLMGETEAEADALVQAMAQAMGTEDLSAARRSPNVLVGTPEQIREEVDRRTRELGITYYFCNLPDPASVERMARVIR